MTPEEISKARAIISRKGYYNKRYHLMRQIERWWTEQFYMYGHHEHAYYPPDVSWSECQRYRKRAEYYSRRRKKNCMSSVKHEIEVEFEEGAVVWHKNLVTNEAIQTRVKDYVAIINSDGSKCVLYHTEDGSPVVNIVGKPRNTNLFATKEECDSWPPYIPGQSYD